MTNETFGLDYRFVQERCSGDLKIENRKKLEVIDELVRRGYRSDPKKDWELKMSQQNALVSTRWFLIKKSEGYNDRDTIYRSFT